MAQAQVEAHKKMMALLGQVKELQDRLSVGGDITPLLMAPEQQVVSVLRKQLEDKRKAHDKTKTKLRAAETKMSNSKFEECNLKNHNAHLMNQVKYTDEQMRLMSEEHREIVEDLRAKLRKSLSQNEVVVSQEKFLSLEQELKRATKALDDYKKINTIQMDRLMQRTAPKKHIEDNELSGLKDELLQLHRKKEEAQHLLNTSEETKKKMEEEITMLKTDKENLKKTTGCAIWEISRLTGEKEQNEKRAQKELQTRIHEKNQEIDKLTDRLEIANFKRSTYAQEIVKLNRELATVQQNAQLTKENLETTMKSNIKFDDLCSENAKLKKMVKDLKFAFKVAQKENKFAQEILEEKDKYIMEQESTVMHRMQILEKELEDSQAILIKVLELKNTRRTGSSNNEETLKQKQRQDEPANGFAWFVEQNREYVVEQVGEDGIEMQHKEFEKRWNALSAYGKNWYSEMAKKHHSKIRC